MQIEMKPVGNKEKTGRMWTLDLGNERVVLTDHEGIVVIEFPAPDAAAFFQFPSFSQSIRWFGIRIGKSVWSFDVSKVDLTLIRRYVDRQIALAGPEAVQQVRTSAVRAMLLGAVCAIAGVVLTVASFVAAANQPGGRRYSITWGLMLFGVVWFCRGLYGYRHYHRLLDLAGAADE